MEANRILLNVNNLSVKYGSIIAIKRIEFEIKEGNFETIIGSNGAGKSTVLKAIIGILKPFEGKIEFPVGNEIQRLPPFKIAKMGVGYVPEGRSVLRRMSVLENLKMGAYTYSDRKKFNINLENIFNKFTKLEERRKQLADTLSGGEQQMLAIARALMAAPKLLLLDEPSLGLAPIFIKELFEKIREINEEGITILLVEQNTKLALSYASWGYIIENGQIIIKDSTKRLSESEEVRTAYLGE